MKRRTPEQVVADVGHRIRELRNGLTMTQAAAAEHLGISIQYFRRVETGRVNVSVYALAEFAKMFKVEPSALLERPSKRIRPKRGRPKLPPPRLPS